MAAARPLVLCAGLAVIPLVLVQIPDVQVKSFRQEWASTNGPLGSLTGLFLLVALVKYYAMGYIQLHNSCIVHFSYYCIE